MMNVFSRNVCLLQYVGYSCATLRTAKQHVGWEGGQKEIRDQLEVHLFHGLPTSAPMLVIDLAPALATIEQRVKRQQLVCFTCTCTPLFAIPKPISQQFLLFDLIDIERPPYI